MKPAPVGTRIIYIPWKNDKRYKSGRGVLINDPYRPSDTRNITSEPYIRLDSGENGSCGGWHNLELEINENSLGKFPKKEGIICPLLSRQL